MQAHKRLNPFVRLSTQVKYTTKCFTCKDKRTKNACKKNQNKKSGGKNHEKRYQ
jgi:hypothetical protein